MRRALLPLALLAACGGGSTEEPTTSARPVAVPEDAVGGAPVLVLRTTNGATIDPQVYADLNRMFNEQIDVTSLFMRGGLRTDDQGEPITPPAADLSGTAVEQVASFAGSGQVVPGATDTCGNPLIASFVTPPMVTEAGGDLGDLEPTICDGGACDAIRHGTVEVVLSNVRFDGMLDVVVNIQPDPLTRTPALWGSLIGTFLSDLNPGFLQVPVMLHAEQFQFGLFGVLQRVKTYVHPGIGVREVIVLPHAERPFSQREMLVTWIPGSGQDCVDRWNSEFTGIPPFGCAEAQAVGIDRTATGGFGVYKTYTNEGADPSVLATLQNALSWQLQTGAVCAPVGEKSVYLKQGQVELFTCPESLGDVDTCLALQDMEEFACNPIAETETVLEPDGATPIPLVEQREPYVLRYDPLLPFAGQVELEITVDDDTVLYLPTDELGSGGADRFTSIMGPAGPVELPTAIKDEHCDEDPAFRYDVGGVWPAGVYTATLTMGATDPDLYVHVTSLDTWKF
ncbi:MAG: hypothetical protein H6735_32290 [Alphaproteobacteria bacterium]|nr:hypothetical protein [Alphaproteobacteria bacterium]